MMKFYRAILVTLFICTALAGKGQIPTVTEKFTTRDTLKVKSLYADFAFLFLLSDDEMSKNIDLNLVDGAHMRYVFKHSDLDLIFRQNVERNHDASYSYNHYFVLSSGICKYNNLANDRATFRHLYPEAIFIFQNNSDRGLTKRFQTGALLYPYNLHLPNFKLNFGIGAVYDWSTWRVNDAAQIADCSPEMQVKINYINSHTPLRYNMYQQSNEFRPMLVVDAHFRVTKVLQMQLSTSFQQSLFSPYSKEIQNVYPDLGKVYPYILTRLEIDCRIHKYFSLQSVFAMDYENNNLALYDSSWQYNMMFGLVFHLHGREL